MSIPPSLNTPYTIVIPTEDNQGVPSSCISILQHGNGEYHNSKQYGDDMPGESSPKVEYLKPYNINMDVGFFSRNVYFAYASQIVTKAWKIGKSRPLESHELWAPTHEDSIASTYALFRKRYDQLLQMSKAAKGDLVTGKGDRRGFWLSPRIIYLRALWPTSSVLIIIGSIMTLISVMAQMVMPFCISGIIESVDKNTFDGVYYSIGFLVSGLLSMACNQHQMWCSEKSMHRCRSVSNYMIYKKALGMRTNCGSNSGNDNIESRENSGTKGGRPDPRGGDGNSHTISSVAVLCATDTQRFVDLAPHLQLLWASPFQVVLGSIMLIYFLKYIAFASIGMMLLLYPVTMVLTKLQQRQRQKASPASIKRVTLISEILQGIRVVKMYAWEPFIGQRVEKARSKELKHLMNELTIWAFSTNNMIGFPFVVFAVTFLIVVLTSGTLKASSAFAVITLFTLLKFPILYFGQSLMFSSQVMVAAGHIGEFLADTSNGNTNDDYNNTASQPSSISELTIIYANDKAITGEEGDKENEITKDDIKPLKTVTMENLTAQWNDTNDMFRLENLSLVVNKGEVCGIKGAVGTGKTMLCQTIAQETTIVSGSLYINGVRVNSENDSNAQKGGSDYPSNNRQLVAYASQEPFLISGTVRDNITFFRPFVKEKYLRVLDACALWPDLDQYEDGEMTVVGERGVTLSGGQKARIALARAVYADDCQVIILDDPFSALDAGTGKYIAHTLLGRKRGDTLYSGNTNNNSVKSEDKIKNSIGHKDSTGQCATSLQSRDEEEDEEFPEGVLRDRAVILVTHAKQLIVKYCDSYLHMHHRGKSTWHGSGLDMSPQLSFFTSVSDNSDSEDESPNALDEINDEEVKKTDEKGVFAAFRGTQEKKERLLSQYSKHKLVKAENVEGIISYKTYVRFFKASGGCLFVIGVILSLSIERLSFIMCDYWLVLWTDAAVSTDVPDTILGRLFGLPSAASQEGSMVYWKGYAIVVAITSILGVTRLYLFARGGFRANRVMFSKAFKALLRCPMGYFDSTPIGRILNRFSHDTDRVAFPLIIQMNSMVATTAWMCTAFVVISIIAPLTLVVMIPMTIIALGLMFYYRVANAHLQRLDACSRSDLQAHIHESLTGVAVIRSFGKSNAFLERFAELTDTNIRCAVASVTCKQWISMRSLFLTTLVGGIASFIIWGYRDIISAGSSGMALNWCINYTRSTTFMVSEGLEGEAKLVSVDRLVEAEVDAPCEAPLDEGLVKSKCAQMNHPGCGDNEPISTHPGDMSMPLGNPNPAEWPSKGTITFRDVKMRYRPELPLVLNGCSFTVQAGQRIGVVGRTGSGKSSLIQCLFRLCELEDGVIEIDGRDISSMGLASLRGSRMCIIPQDPALFSGTIRSNVDPFDNYNDEEVVSALKAVTLWDRVLEASVSLSAMCDPKILENEEIWRGLHAVVEERGVNFSTGEKQLLCIARALLRRPSILVMDEATANVDHETDVIIQRVVRTLFTSSTVFEVAHRLHTVIDSDIIIVVKQGQVAEMGSPRELLTRQGGNKGQKSLFSEFVAATGPNMAAELTALAMKGSKYT